METMASVGTAATSPDETAVPGRAQDGRIALAQQEPEAIAKQVLLWWKESAEASAPRRKIRLQCNKMKDGDQWEQGDREAAKRQKRPALTFNMVMGIIAAVEGQEQNNRQEMKYFGRNLDDDKSADRWNKLLRWVLDNNEGDFEISRAFSEMLTGGEGWICPEVCYLDDPEGEIRLEFVDDSEIFDDPLSIHPVGTDARHRIRAKMLTADEGEALWPGKFQSTIDARMIENSVISETDGKGYPDIYLSPDRKDGIKRFDRNSKTWAVLQTWWWQIEPGWVVVNEATGLLDEMDEETFQAKKDERRQEQIAALQSIMAAPPAIPGQMPGAPLAPPAQGTAGDNMAQPGPSDGDADNMGMGAGAPPMGGPLGMPAMPRPQIPPPLKAEQRSIKRVYEAFVVYDTVLECAPLKPKLKIFPATPVRGMWRKSKKDWAGLVEGIIDAQKQHNVEQSAILQLIQLMPKSSWMAPKGAFHNKQDWEAGVAQPGKMLEYNSARGKPEQIQAAPIPRHLIDMAFSRPQAMRDISGVNVELTGQRQGSDAGVVMEQRAKAAQTVLAPLFENARRTRKVLGKVLLAFMQAYLTPGRQIRVLGADRTGEVIAVDQDMLQGRYDLAVDETDSTVNDRVATLNIMQTTLPQMMKAGVPIPPEFVDLLPIDPKIRDSWKRMLVWQQTLNGTLPPVGWEPGMDPHAFLPAPAGAPPPAGPPPAI